MQLCKKTTVMQQSVHAYISIYFYRMLCDWRFFIIFTAQFKQRNSKHRYPLSIEVAIKNGCNKIFRLAHERG